MLQKGSNACNIFDIPNEILIEILLHTNARERAVLGNCSDRFNRLVFKERKLLRNLDFSNEGRLTTALYIQQYFNNKDTDKHIVRVNLRNVNCMEPGRMLNDYIGKALNLVDINLHGIELEDIRQLESFLSPLVHVRRLSMNWPITLTDDGADYHIIRQVLLNIFSRLTYFSVKTRYYGCLWEFLHMIDLCQELIELHIDHGNRDGARSDFGGMIPELRKLEIFEFCGDFAYAFKEEFFDLLPKPEKWIDFRLVKPLDERCFHLEKNIEVCKELSESNCIKQLIDRWEWSLGKCLLFESLLKAVLKITQEDSPQKFCSSQLGGKERCVLKIEDAKLLLQNPKHQIKYLYLSDSIGTESKVHLFSFATPNLTELYLSGVMKIKISTFTENFWQEENHLLNRRPRSSFEILVENTPLVQDLTINGRPEELELDEVWDLGPLYLIQGWKNLKSLRLLSIPICDGEFLIEISKQCKYLEKLEFYNLGPSYACCYTEELSLMLAHCQNLTDFSMHASNIGTVSGVLLSLANNLQLRRVRLRSSGNRNTTVHLVSSVEQLLRRCSGLTTFVCIIDRISRATSDKLTSVLRRLRRELNRPSLQFQVVCKSNAETASKMDTVCEDSTGPTFPHTLDEFSYL